MRGRTILSAGLCVALILGGCSAPMDDATYRWERSKTEEELEAENKAAENEVIEQYFEDGLPRKIKYVYSDLGDCLDALADGDTVLAIEKSVKTKVAIEDYLEEEAPCEAVSDLHSMTKSALEEAALAADDMTHAAYSSSSYLDSASGHLRNFKYWVDSCTEETERLKAEYGIGGD